MKWKVVEWASRDRERWGGGGGDMLRVVHIYLDVVMVDENIQQIL